MNPTIRSRSLLFVSALTLAVALGPLGTIAHAQIAKAAGASPDALSAALFGGIVRGTTSAFDTVNDVRLVVAAHGPVLGVFVNGNGAPVTGHIPIWPASSGFGQFPTVTFSPTLGGGAFLVTWNASTALPPYTNSTYGRVVSFTQSGHVASGVFLLSDTATAAEVGSAPAVAHSPGQFLVTWQTTAGAIRGRLLNEATLSAGPTFAISNTNAQYPSAAYNPTTNQFGVGYSGADIYAQCAAITVNPPWCGSSVLAIVSPSGSVVSRSTFNFALSTFITDLAVNPTTGRYVMTWSQGDGTRAAEFAANGTLLGMGLVSGAVGGYDSGSLAYSSASGTFLVVGHGWTGNVAAAELSSRGNRISGVIEASNSFATSGTYYPRVSYGGNRWMTTYSRDFTSVQTHGITTTSANGGGNSALPAPGAPPPPPTGGGTTTPPPPTGCTSPSPGSGWTCVNGGWLPPSGGGTTTPPPSTGGCAGTAPFAGAVCQNGGWVPGTGGTGGGTGGSTGGCPGTAPFPGAVCQNGGWVPGTGGTGGGTGGSTGGCPGTAPFPGAVCQNGGWVPGTGGTGGSTGGCPGTAPFPGAVCQNGGWVPGTGGTGGTGGSTGGCPGTAPFPGAVCQNGGWVPGTGGSTGGSTGSTCTTPSPGAGWTCVNGGWIPGGTTAPPPPTSTCTTPSPGTGWTCRNGGWLPPGIASVTLTPLATLARNVEVSNNRRTALVPAPQPHHRSTVV